MLEYRTRLTFIILLLAFGSFHCVAQQADFVVAQRIRLTPAESGGWIEVLLDSRLTPKVRKEMWGVGDWEFVFANDEVLHTAFKVKPPKTAQLRVVDDNRHELKRFSLDQPLAKITEATLPSGNHIFLVAQDYSVGFGSYAGVSTQLLQITNGGFRWIDAIDAKSKKVERIRLQRALKSDWRLIRRNGADVLSIYCRPDSSNANDFLTHFVRYRFARGNWAKYERVKKGFWESDEEFPSAAEFPIH